MTFTRDRVADRPLNASVFVMVAGPSSIGKSTCIRDLQGRYRPDVLTLHDDDLLANMLRRLRLSQHAGHLNRDGEWRREAEKVSMVEDIVALHHLEWCCAERAQSRVIVAEGYM